MKLTIGVYKFSPLQIMVHAVAWLLLAWLAGDYFGGNLGVNPIQAATQRAGRYAIVFLILSLACTPLNTLFGLRQALSARRALGLYAFAFAALHLLIFAWLDFAFDWSLLKLEVAEKRYILVGLAAFTILALLAATSFKWWMKRLGKNWKRLHRLVYLAGLLVVLHYAWAKKGDLLRLQGDIWWPLLAGIIVSTLLVLRLPAVRRAASQQRARLSRCLSLAVASHD
ncbi:MAG: sulfoxide reductase heme-binding subunit YedZ [Anaerolineales bacterium]|nr:sulfoxide reductase heme-binding subunit YedZ [Anaerolineales bacterium]